MPGKRQRAVQRETVWLRRVLIGILVVAVLVAGVFGFRAVASFVYWNDAAHQNEPISGWMTPRYVARSWNVPPEVVADALGLKRGGGQGPVSLNEIADAQGVELGVIIETLHSAISTHKAKH